MKDMFKNMETDESGQLAFEELKAGLHKLGSQLSEAEVLMVMNSVSSISLLSLKPRSGSGRVWVLARELETRLNLVFENLENWCRVLDGVGHASLVVCITSWGSYLCLEDSEMSPIVTLCRSFVQSCEAVGPGVECMVANMLCSSLSLSGSPL